MEPVRPKPKKPAYRSVVSNNLSGDFPCIVTAYYLALPGQERYVLGSLEADRRMNGDEWTADGTRVAHGIIAMDQRFPMGATVIIPGYGTGVKHDHGGAIIGNRIDVHMGEGDAGRIKAMQWGRRHLICTRI